MTYLKSRKEWDIYFNQFGKKYHFSNVALQKKCYIYYGIMSKVLIFDTQKCISSLNPSQHHGNSVLRTHPTTTEIIELSVGAEQLQRKYRAINGRRTAVAQIQSCQWAPNSCRANIRAAVLLRLAGFDLFPSESKPAAGDCILLKQRRHISLQILSAKLSSCRCSGLLIFNDVLMRVRTLEIIIQGINGCGTSEDRKKMLV